MSTITVIGNAVAEPELTFTPSGKAVARVRIAENSRRRQGESWVDGPTSYHDVQVWGAAAENVAETLTTGMRVIVVGRLEQEHYETKDGDKRSTWRITTDAIGPDLTFATATVERATRASTPGGDA